jgi:hypothetical protein
MKIRNLIYTLAIAAVSFIMTGCEQPVEPKAQMVNFTVRYSELSYNHAIINVKHDGPEDITWYGFVTDNVKKNDFELFYEKYNEIIMAGGAPDLKKETDRNILVENLEEAKEYRYIVFGLKENGELYDNVGVGSIDFKTERNIYKMSKTEDWEITHLGRNEEKSKELIEVKSKKGGRFAW